MTFEKLQELMQVRKDFFEQRTISDATLMAQMKVYAANLGAVPDDIAEAAFYTALGSCRYQSQFLADWNDAVRKILRKRYPSDAALWREMLTAAHRISDCYAVHANGGYAGERKGERLNEARRIFEALPEFVREWAGSPEGLCELVNHNTKSELNRFTRPQFNRMLAEAPLHELLQSNAAPLLHQGEAPAAQLCSREKTA